MKEKVKRFSLILVLEIAILYLFEAVFFTLFNLFKYSSGVQERLEISNEAITGIYQDYVLGSTIMYAVSFLYIILFFIIFIKGNKWAALGVGGIAIVLSFVKPFTYISGTLKALLFNFESEGLIQVMCLIVALALMIYVTLMIRKLFI